MEEKENLEKKALNSSNDYSKELALLSTEISQATISKYCVVILNFDLDPVDDFSNRWCKLALRLAKSCSTSA